MRVDFTGRQTDITPDLRHYTEKRLQKLARLLRERFGMHVILGAEKHRRVAEITLKFRHHTLVGIEETADARSSINGALDKLERQTVRLLEMRRTRKRRPKSGSTLRINVLGAERAGSAQDRSRFQP